MLAHGALRHLEMMKNRNSSQGGTSLKMDLCPPSAAWWKGGRRHEKDIQAKSDQISMLGPMRIEKRGYCNIL